MFFSLAAIFLMAWRWERFAGAFSTPFLDRWLASIFLILILVGAVSYSGLDVGRIQRSSGEETRLGRSPWAVAMRRFRENRLAVYSIYVIILFYALAILAPILAPYDPAAIPDVMTNRYLPPSWDHPFGTDEFGRQPGALWGEGISVHRASGDDHRQDDRHAVRVGGGVFWWGRRQRPDEDRGRLDSVPDVLPDAHVGGGVRGEHRGAGTDPRPHGLARHGPVHPGSSAARSCRSRTRLSRSRRVPSDSRRTASSFGT
jgi:hypothetical protein